MDGGPRLDAAAPRRRGRPRAYEPDVALAKALDLFRKAGAGTAPPAFAQPALPQQLAPVAPAYPPQQQVPMAPPAPAQAPYGQPAMPQAGVLPPWMGPPR